MSKQAFLLLCNKTSTQLLAQYQLLYNATKTMGECIVLYHLQREQHENIPGAAVYPFTDEVLTRLNYIPIGFSLLPGNNHFPLLKFYNEHPDFDYYWIVEDDVRFNGDWQQFFQAFDDVSSDFISTHIHPFRDAPAWPWWGTLANSYQCIPVEQRIKSFNPVYRLSRHALQHIHQSLKAMWVGHHEVLLPTLLHKGGFSLMDMGGRGRFTPEPFRDRFYDAIDLKRDGSILEGTMRWRPVFREMGSSVDKLYHPVKA
ncbi:DUF3405 domain-containing protein [uncultured Chitinophaga sp.]|uniref:DUF3405 domain-containing protein n=1 Tax=uncultured Chitinophaga sp. TaxID=339340 RepID=UPI0025FD47ED|nr:DUF3405 domain-containing protein [uncultured Chitinophaga sp.]